MDLFCRDAERRVDGLFQALWDNDDAAKYRAALRILDGKLAWLERGILAMEERERHPTLAPAEAARPVAVR